MICPVLLRPPDLVSERSKLFSGAFLVRFEKSSTVIERRDGVYGLNDFNGMLSDLFPFYLLAGFHFHDRLFAVRLITAHGAGATAEFSEHLHGVHIRHDNFEPGL